MKYYGITKKKTRDIQEQENNVCRLLGNLSEQSFTPLYFVKQSTGVCVSEMHV